ncbi:MAG TPA: low affinity iron permease family protein [Candidatus Binatia bacterium]|jgi:low affinity Fe/Cu permease|nr:low affinity iron permease family protein [Candidatus Binatia bacterium]
MSTTKSEGSGRSGLEDLFHRFAGAAARATGTPWAFMSAVGIIVVWAVLGPAFGYSDTWQLVINTSTTIITFLMVFLIQNTQNRDAAGIHLKLDELIKATGGARNTMIDLEKLSDQQLRDLEEDYRRISCGEDEPDET